MSDYESDHQSDENEDVITPAELIVKLEEVSTNQNNADFKLLKDTLTLTQA